MYTFELSDRYLSNEEQVVFQNYLDANGLDNSIWEVFSCLFQSSVGHVKPMLLRTFKDDNLYGVAVIIKCQKYGRSFFSNKLVAKLVDAVNLPFYLWIKFGCCMDMMSNPGFVKDPEKTDEVIRAMAAYLKGQNLLTVIYDLTENAEHFDSASILPALPQALIDCTNYTTVADYTAHYKNIKRKVKKFANKQGVYTRVDHQLSEEQLTELRKCFQATIDKSVIYLPYQDLYLNAALTTGRTKIDNIYHFIATINGEFIGYQTALVTGKYLNALHGAFDRTLKTTFHAYDIMFVKMAEFAIENGLEFVDFGGVANFTKEKMANTLRGTSYFIYSKYPLLQKAINLMFRFTTIQGEDQLKFSQGSTVKAEG
ncbi:MAG: GNAT family N-acetyltransferase [Bacteroidota bacterium]